MQMKMMTMMRMLKLQNMQGNCSIVPLTKKMMSLMKVTVSSNIELKMSVIAKGQ